jgi:small-conductance mechanosensitive channel
VANLTGKVTRIGLRATSLRTFDGAEVVVPNADLISNNVVNWTLSDNTRRLDVPVNVAFGSDLQKAARILLHVAAEHPEVARSPEPEVLFNSFGENAVELVLRFWLPDAGAFPRVRSDLYFAMDKGLREAGIEVSVPQRLVTLRTDTRGQRETDDDAVAISSPGAGRA